MKKIALIFISLFIGINLYPQSGKKVEMGFPVDMECIAQPYYRLRQDGKPGRVIVLKLKGPKLLGKAQVEVAVKGKKEVNDIPASDTAYSFCTVLLPEGIGLKEEANVTITLRQNFSKLKKSFIVPPMRQWTVYIYSHSHVDIGYTNTQENVEILHKTNIDEGIKLAEATKDYPPGAPYRWNPEVTWPLERYWKGATSEQKERILEAIKKNYLCIDANYLNTNTSACNDEEMFQMFRFSREMQKLTGKPMNTFQQMDIPGMSWGLVPVMAQQGVKYIMSWPNSARAGYAHELDEKPFWWIGPDKKSKVLFFQPGGYGNSGSMKKGGETGRPWFGQRDPGKVPPFIKTGTADVNFLKALSQRERKDYPYDYYVVSWSLWDNCPLDADLSEAVKKWNSEYAFPHLIIAGATEIMSMIETKYGDKLPVVEGDFTEYWTDGLGTAAGLIAANRNSKEKLVQAEILWTMLHPGKPAPRKDFDEAWRYIALGTEHTWCAENPSEPFFQDAIWKVKQSYFREAVDQTEAMMEKAIAPATDRSTGALGPVEGPSNGGIVVFNTNSWIHGGLITLSKAESAKGNRVVDDKGNDVLSQRLSTGELVFLSSDVPPFGSRHYRVVKGEQPVFDGCSIEGTTLNNKHLKVTLSKETGNITHLVTLASGHNYSDVKVNGGLNAFRWMPGDSDNAVADSVISISVTEEGPLVVELSVLSKGKGCRSVTRSVRLIFNQPSVEITNIVDKLPLIDKDGIHFGFGFDIQQATTRMDIPWGIVRVEKDQWSMGNRNWLTMQRWIDISNERDGVTWCSLDAPLAESGAMTANQTGTWNGERKPWLRKLEPNGTVYSWVMNNHWFTNFPLTQDGPVKFRYRILPHGVYDASAANRFGLEQAQPLVHLAADKNAISEPIVAVEGSPSVTVSIVKSTEQPGWTVIRLRSVSERDEKVKLSWPAGSPKAVSICDLEEIPAKPVSNDITVPANGMLTLIAEW